jgi:hypothetical protein
MLVQPELLRDGISRWRMKALTMFVVAVAAVVMAGVPAHGRTQPAMFCWSPDAEFPVACEEEEEEDGYTIPSTGAGVSEAAADR